MNQVSILFSSLSNGILSIGKYRLFSFFLFSGLIALALFIVLAAISWFLGGLIGSSLIELIPWFAERGAGTGKWSGRILSILIFIILFKYILLIATAPLMSKMSEKIESFYAPNLDRLHLNIGQSIHRGIKFSLRSLFFELLLTIAVLVLGLIPFVGLISVPLLYLIQSYYAGAGIMDLCLERFNTIKESVEFNRKYRLLTIAYGAIYLGVLLIPILGLFLSPVISTSISTHGTLDILKQNRA